MGGMSRKFPEFVPATKISYLLGRPKTIHLRKCKLIRDHEDQAIEYIFDQSKIAIGAMDDNDLVIDDDTISRPAATLPVKIAQATSRHGPDGSEMNSAAAVPMASAAAVAAIRETGGLPGLML